jgi:hypothetical protein
MAATPSGQGHRHSSSVVDAQGHKIGELEAIYVDTCTDLPSFGTVKVGMPPRHRLVFVPLDQATVGPGYRNCPLCEPWSCCWSRRVGRGRGFRAGDLEHGDESFRGDADLVDEGFDDGFAFGGRVGVDDLAQVAGEVADRRRPRGLGLAGDHVGEFVTAGRWLGDLVVQVAEPGPGGGADVAGAAVGAGDQAGEVVVAGAGGPLLVRPGPTGGDPRGLREGLPADECLVGVGHADVAAGARITSRA